MIDLMLLGSGAMMPLADRWLSSLLVRCDREQILFDCGEGTQIPWRASHWGFRQTAAICLSHCHADHVAGLPGVLHSLANSDRTEPVTIFGPEGTAYVVEGLRRIASPLPFEVDVKELTGESNFALPGGLIGRAIPGRHRVPSLIYRVDLPRTPRFDRARAESLGIPRELWSRLKNGAPVVSGGRTIEPSEVLGPPRRGLSFGFMTDTRPVPGAAEFLREVDLLSSEGTYGDSQMLDRAESHMHMTFAEAAGIARDASVGELWLTHFSPAMSDPSLFASEAESIFQKTRLGYSGLTTTLKFGEE
jgi:ribonuclease Z